MKKFLLGLILLACCFVIEAQTIFDPNDPVITYNAGAPAGSQSNPNQAFGYNIIKWVRTVRMSYNTDRYKCYMIGNIPFRLRFPDSYNPTANDGKKYPIMLFFHGGGEATANTRDNEFHLLNGGSTFPEKIMYGTQDAFILFPQSRNVGWDNSYYTPMNIVIDSLIKNCKGDEDRVLSMGLSIGGFAAMDYSIQYPKRASVIIPNSPVFLSGYAPSFGPALQIPLWMGSGGQDTNPDPATAESFVNAYRAMGGDLYWSFYPRQGHVMWDYQWAEEPNYSNRMALSHKANPMVYFNNRFFCPGNPVSSRMGITPGFFAYQWSKNDNTIAGATSSEYIATDFGTYKARFKRTSTSDWSSWSLDPAVVVPICPPIVGTGTGLNGNYYNNTTLTAPVTLNRLDPALNFAFENGSIPGPGMANNNYSTRWTGKIQPQFSETYTIYTKSDDGIRLWINGALLIDNYADHGPTENTANFSFLAGQKYDIKIEYYNRGGSGTMYLKWSSANTVKQMVPTKQLYPEGTGDPAAPVCTSNLLPANNANLPTANSATLSWNPQVLAGSYDVYLWTGATPPATPIANVSTTSYTAPGLTPGNTYKWYIAPRNGTGVATGCAAANTSTFTINPYPPACVNNLTPGNGSVIASANSATFTWESAPTATSYDLYVWIGATPSATPVANVTTLSYSVNNLLPSTEYFWCVVPKNISGQAGDCNLYNKTHFTTGNATVAPVCVTNTAPANGTTLATQTTASLTWNTAVNATSYDVYIWTGLTPPASPTTNVPSASYNVGGLTASTVYNWYVAPRNAAGAATGCDVSNKSTFTTATAVIPIPGCATNTAPANAAVLATQTTAALSWSTVANATSYDVYLWTGATPPVTPTANVATTNYNATLLTAGSLYNWYIIPRNASGPATGCDLTNKTTFTTAAIPVPLCVTNTSPANASVLATQTTATLTWPAAATATSYDVYLWTGATPPVTPTANVATTTYNATLLTAGSLYNWYIVPRNASGPATGCDISNKTTFTTAAIPVPLCVTNTSPANASVLATQTTATLTWPAAATATSYDVYLWTGATPPVTPTANVATTTYNATLLTAGSLYNWFIVPRNASGPATGCDISNKTTFTTAAIPVPLCVTNTSPANASVLATQTTATLTWPAAATATSYDVYLWTGATPPVTPTANVATTTYNATLLTAGSLYNWYIVPRNASGPATGCDISNKTTFTTAAIPVPLCVTNTSPANASVLATQTTATLTWPAAATATSYDVYLWTGATPPVTPTANVAATTYNATLLTAGSLYNWYIVPRNASGPATGCDVSNKTTFTTAAIPVPLCATNTLPVSGSVIVTQTSAGLVWSNVANAATYDVYLWTGATPPVTPTANVATNSYNASLLTANTLYHWYIVPKNVSGAATGCDIANQSTFTTAPASIVLPDCAVNNTPANASTLLTQTTATLTWGSVALAESYDVYLWTGATPPATPTTNVTTTSYSASLLTANTLYNWFIVPRNADGPATGCDLSSKSTFTTAAIPVPLCVTNTSPANAAVLATQTTATLTWPAAATATSYDVYLWTGATPPVTPTANVATTTYNATLLTAGSLYNWFIVPRNASGPATGCDLSNKTTFTTAAIPVPLCVTNTTPANAAVLATQTTATLTWPAAATATSYDVYLWTGATPPVTPTANVATTTYNATLLTAGSLYNWYIVPRNASGPATGCDISNKTTFTTAAIPVPLCVTNTSPANAAVLATQTTATLTWPAAATATSYDVYLWTGATPPVTPTANVAATTYNATLLTAGSLYNWYIVPRNAGGPATGCDLSNKTTFTTASIVVPVPLCVTNTSPANAAVLATQTTATLTWPAAATATSYDVYLWTGATPPVTPTANVATTTYNATLLTAGSLYNWYIVPRNASGPATGCDVSNRTTFTTAAIPVPLCVTNTSPANAAVLATQTTVTLTWPAAATATSYDVYLWTGATPPVTPTANVAATTYNATLLTAGTVYNWYIAPRNAGGAASGCSVANRTSFTTAGSTPTPGLGTGLQGVYYNGTAFAGTPLLTRIDPTINFELTYSTVLSPAPGIVPQDNYSVRWTGQVKPLYSETYTFYTLSDDGIRLWVNGVQLVNNFVNQGATEKSGTIALTAGQKYDIVIEYFEGTGEAVTKLSWSGASTPKAIVPQTQLFPPGFVDPTVPGCATNTAPANGSTIATASTAALVWNAAPDATSYDVYIWTGATPPASPTANTTTATYNANGLTASTLYNWYVIPKNSAGSAAGCNANSTSFTTGAPAPACTGNLLPANNAVLVTANTATLSWTTAATATSYDVYIWTGATPPASPTANVATATYNASGLTAATSYNWYVSPRNAGGAATGCITSQTAFVTAAAPAPACTINTSPANGATIATPNTAALTWNAAVNATSYDVYVWTGATPPVTPTANTALTSYTATGLAPSTSYNWYVVPKNAAGSATGCATTNKTTFISGAPAAGTGLQGVYYNGIAFAGTPLLTRIDPTINFELTYSTVLSPAPGIVPPDNYSVRWTGQVKALFTETYTFYTLSDDGIRLWVNGVQLVNNFVNQGATEKSGTIALVAGQKYDILIEYYENVGEAVTKLSWSSASTPKAIVPQSQLYPPGFVDPTIPGCAVNTTPANGSTIVAAATAALAWNAAPDATSYDVYLWTGATAPASPTANTTTASYNASGLNASTLYNWYVIPKNSVGSASGCSASSTSFTTGAPAPACTNNLLPANNAVLASANTATLTWTAAATATSYDVYIWTGATPPASPTINVATTTYNAIALTAGTAYNWYVSPRNAGGAATGCVNNKTVFVTAAAPVPACAVNTSPANGSTLLTSNTAVLTWNAALNATSYDVYVWTGATPPATPTANVTSTSYNASGLTIASLYNWYVVPKNAAGGASGCGTTSRFTFTTASAPDGTGLQGDYYNGTAFAGTPLLTRIDPIINFELTYSTVLSPAPGIVPQDNFSVRWTGQVKAQFTETYTFYTLSDDGIRLWVNGIQLVNNFVNQGATEKSGTIALVAGQRYDIIIEYYEATGEAVTKLSWSGASTPKALVPQAQLYPPGAALVLAAPVQTQTTTLAAQTVSSLPTLTSSVSPNPVSPGQSARVQITSDKTGSANVSIVNSNGFIISTQKINLVPGTNTVTVNTSALGLGFYIINITGGSTPVNLKLMVE